MKSPDDVVDALRALGLRASPESIRALLEHCTKTRASPVETCEQLVALERRERDACNLAQRTRLACLGKFKTLDKFDWNHPRSIDRPLYEELHALDFIEARQNVLFRGPSGAGKTVLAQNLGLAALEKLQRSRKMTRLCSAEVGQPWIAIRDRDRSPGGRRWRVEARSPRSLLRDRGLL
jgi:DNA replication protein DnaC